jgi:hypothetical protein
LGFSNPKKAMPFRMLEAMSGCKMCDPRHR